MNDANQDVNNLVTCKKCGITTLAWAKSKVGKWYLAETKRSADCNGREFVRRFNNSTGVHGKNYTKGVGSAWIPYHKCNTSLIDELKIFNEYKDKALEEIQKTRDYVYNEAIPQIDKLSPLESDGGMAKYSLETLKEKKFLETLYENHIKIEFDGVERTIKSGEFNNVRYAEKRIEELEQSIDKIINIIVSIKHEFNNIEFDRTSTIENSITSDDYIHLKYGIRVNV